MFLKKNFVTFLHFKNVFYYYLNVFYIYDDNGWQLHSILYTARKSVWHLKLISQSLTP